MSLELPASTVDPSKTIDVYADGGSGSDLVRIVGTSGNNTVTVTSGAVTLGVMTLTRTSIELDDFDGVGGTDQLTVTGGTWHQADDLQNGTNVCNVTASSSAVVVFNTTQHIGALSVTSSATATLAARGGSYDVTPARVITVSSLDLGSDINSHATGTLDIKDNDLIVKSGNLGTWNGTAYTGLQGILQRSLHDGAWDLPGIITSLADDDGPYTAIGIAKASDVFGISSSGTASWIQGAGLTVGVTGSDILLKYTYTGDCNLDGEINGDDYFQIDSHVNLSGSAFDYFNGDLNLDGLINGDDYFFIDSNSPGQHDPL